MHATKPCLASTMECVRSRPLHAFTSIAYENVTLSNSASVDSRAWHDNRWSGTICQHPRNNTACIRLKNISDAKDDEREEGDKGESIKDFMPGDYPPCVKERATFMAPFAFERFHEHPYTETSPDTHAHFAPTHLDDPAFSAAALPFLDDERCGCRRVKQAAPA